MNYQNIVIMLLIVIIITMLYLGSKSITLLKKRNERKTILPGVPTPQQKILPGVPTPNKKEGFENFGLMPESVNSGVLLQGWYPTHNPKPEFSRLDEEEQYKNYPVFKADSPYNNNIRYWRKPNNGKCSPAGMCGNFYSFKKTKIPPMPPCLGFSQSRVNYYNSEK